MIKIILPNYTFLYPTIIYMKTFDDYFWSVTGDSKSTLKEMPQNSHRFLK